MMVTLMWSINDGGCCDDGCGAERSSGDEVEKEPPTLKSWFP